MTPDRRALGERPFLVTVRDEYATLRYARIVIANGVQPAMEATSDRPIGSLGWSLSVEECADALASDAPGVTAEMPACESCRYLTTQRDITDEARSYCRLQQIDLTDVMDGFGCTFHTSLERSEPGVTETKMCKAHHPSGADCELPEGHTEDHRGTDGYHLIRWPLLIVTSETPAPLPVITDEERDELDRLLADLLLPTFSGREREIARCVARLAMKHLAVTAETDLRARLTSNVRKAADKAVENVTVPDDAMDDDAEIQRLIHEAWLAVLLTALGGRA